MVEKVNAWATMDTINPDDKITHIERTIEKGTSKEFWLSRPCPKGVNPDDWEESEQARWDKIFKNKGVR